MYLLMPLTYFLKWLPSDFPARVEFLLGYVIRVYHIMIINVNIECNNQW